MRAVALRLEALDALSRCSRPPSRSPVNARPEPTIRCPSTRMVSLVLRVGQMQDLPAERAATCRTRRGSRAARRGRAAPGRAAGPRALPRRARARAAYSSSTSSVSPWRPISARARLVRSVSSCSARSRVVGVVESTSSSSRARSPWPGSGPATRTASHRPSIELVEPVEIALADPVAPRAAQVLRVGGQRGERGVAPLGRSRPPTAGARSPRSRRRARDGRRHRTRGSRARRSAAYSLIVASITNRESPFAPACRTRLLSTSEARPSSVSICVPLRPLTLPATASTASKVAPEKAASSSKSRCSPGSSSS